MIDDGIVNSENSHAFCELALQKRENLPTLPYSEDWVSVAKASRWKEQDGLISKFWQMETGLRLRILRPRSADTKNLDEFIPEYWKLM